AALAPLATGAVEGAVEENFATFTKDSACADADCTEAEEDWAVSTASRDFYGYSITNVADVMATGAAPTYEKIGPVTYDITTTKTITGYDAATGELTYNSVKSFACSAETAVPCDTDVSQLNIAFQTQVIGATGLAIGGIMDVTKAAFTAGMLGQDLESLGAGQMTAEMMSSHIADASNGMQGEPFNMPEAMADDLAASIVANNFWDLTAASFSEQTGGNMTIGEMYEIGESTSANFDNASGNYAFYNAMMPTGEDIALTGMLGVLVLAGHCDSYPTENMSTLMAAVGGGTGEMTGVMQRASLWGYMAMMDETTPDLATTIARDISMCAGVGMTFLGYGGGDETLGIGDQTGMAVNVSTRLSYFGITMDEMSAMGLLFGDGDDVITGLLESSEDGTQFGTAAILSMDAATAMATYGLDAANYGAVMAWVGGWATDATSLPMILLGGSGDMTASLFVNTTFGAEDPLNGGYLDNSLNMGGAWMLLGGSENVDLDPAVSGNALYGPLGLTTSTGSAIFLYGELSGYTPPIDFATMGPGEPMAWNEATIGALYGVDANAAGAMRALMMGPIYGTTSESFVPGYLMSTFGTTPYLTQSFNNWLLGWHDPVNAYLATGNPMDMTVGWMSLETNETYYGSNGVLNGDGTNYTVCTGEAGDCDQGETLAEDGSTQLSWRNDAMMAATFGLIMPESLVGTTGGFLTGDGDKVDVSGYAIADVTCDGTDEVKGIPVDVCTASVTATERNIQANLLSTYSLLDATPGALPVYFGSDITMMAEEISGLIIAGESTSTFYLDTRAHGSQASTPTMDDLTPVFEIQSASTIADDDAETMESAIVQNQDKMTYWTNFDSWIDFVTLLFWVGGIAMIALGMIGAANAPSEEELPAAVAQEAAEDEAKADDAPSEEE
ncbi:MAG: hypothetical protein O3C36_04860, partial [archaeon]|nr:hypothetical protein [archaeon]